MSSAIDRQHRQHAVPAKDRSKSTSGAWICLKPSFSANEASGRHSQRDSGKKHSPSHGDCGHADICRTAILNGAVLSCSEATS